MTSKSRGRSASSADESYALVSWRDRGQRGIREDAESPADPEAVRDAKGALSQRMRGNRGYVATDDQPALLASMDLDLASKRSPSFAKLRRDLAALVGKN